MCGILAITSKKPLGKAYTDNVVQAMLTSLNKRGPDDARFVRLHDDRIVLGQTRLSIVDIEGGKQPMKDTEAPITIVFNGEIYNFGALTKTLTAAGHHFSSRSDTEVILKAYKEWGAACVEHLEGMFAFIIWDAQKEIVFMARDRFGKKPLYYTKQDDGTFLIASEIKTLFASGKVKGIIDPVALDSYLTLLHVSPDRSLYSNIHVVPPAHCAEIQKNGELSLRRYWSMPYKPNQDSYETAKTKIKTLFKEAVASRMVADVEIGSFLSGGIDSTLVSLTASRIAPERPLKTFSLGYGDALNELPYAKQAAEKIKSDHHTLEVHTDRSAELLSVIAYMDEPHADSSNFPQHVLSEYTARSVKVALSGDGADELFMGYGWYWKHAHLPFFQRWWERLFSNPFKGFLKRISIFSPQERSRLWRADRKPKALFSMVPPAIENAAVPPMYKMVLWTLSVYLPGLLLAKIDRTSMMHSLEVRSPFLDTKLAEYVFNIPLSYKCDFKKGAGKLILKDILSEDMPHAFVYRRKEGFGAPITQWLISPTYRTLIATVLLNKQNALYHFLDHGQIQTLVTDFYAQKENGQKKAKLKNAMQLWSLLCLALWFDSHKSFHIYPHD